MEILEKTYIGPCIYCVLNHDKGLLYFGQTRKYNKRTNEHINDLKANRHHNDWLQRVYNDNQKLTIFPVEYCQETLLNEREKFWIKYHNSNNRNNGYNFSEGGDFSPNTLTKEAQQKKADKRRGNPGSLKGRPQSQEWINARITATKGQKRVYSPEHLASIRKAMALKEGTRQRGKQVTITNLLNDEIITFNSKREVEDFLNMTRDTLIHKFYKGRPRKILKECIIGNYLIKR